MGPRRRRGGAISAVNAQRSGAFLQGRIDSAPRIKKEKGSRGAGPAGIGMTDPFAAERFQALFIPMGWTVK